VNIARLIKGITLTDDMLSSCYGVIISGPDVTIRRVGGVTEANEGSGYRAIGCPIHYLISRIEAIPDIAKKMIGGYASDASRALAIRLEDFDRMQGAVVIRIETPDGGVPKIEILMRWVEDGENREARLDDARVKGSFISFIRQGSDEMKKEK